MATQNAYHPLISDDSRFVEMKSNKKPGFLKAVLNGSGLLGTVIFALTAFAPDMMNVPHAMRPWLFVTFIFWFMLYVSGMFTL